MALKQERNADRINGALMCIKACNTALSVPVRSSKSARPKQTKKTWKAPQEKKNGLRHF
jgi:hypothetical protein